MNILAIDSSSKAASVAISSDKKIIGEFFINAGITHSQTLLPLLEDLLKNTGTTLGEIDLLAVSNGPGSFTGLRIGLATAKGLAFEGNIPCLGISTLEGLACNLLATTGLIIPVMDARRNQIYTAGYLSNGENLAVQLQPTTLMIEELGEYLAEHPQGENAFLVGDGAKLCYGRLKERMPKLKIAPNNLLHQRASSIIMAVYQNDNLSRTCSQQELVTEYLRIPQAERELKEKRKGW